MPFTSRQEAFLATFAESELAVLDAAAVRQSEDDARLAKQVERDKLVQRQTAELEAFDAELIAVPIDKVR